MNYRKKVSSSSHKAARVALRAQATSGTVDPDTMPGRFRTESDPTATLNTQTAIREAQLIILSPSRNTSAEEVAKHQLIEFLQNHQHYRGIIDVATLFRDISIEKIAEILFIHNQHIRGFCFYNETDQLMVIERGRSRPLPRETSTLTHENLFFFYRQINTTGADVDLPTAFYGAVTIAFGTLKDEAYQGLGRMRRLNNGHFAGLILGHEDARAIAKQLNHAVLTPQAIDEYITITQEESKKTDNGTNLSLILEDLFEEYFWTYAEARENRIQETYQLFQHMKPFMIEETSDDDDESSVINSSDLPIREAVSAMKARLTQRWTQFVEHHPERREIVNLDALFAEFDRRIDYNKLPATLSIGKRQAEIAELEIDTIEELETTATNVSDQLQERDQINDAIDMPPIEFNPAQPLKWEGDYRHLMTSNAPEFTLLGITCRHAAPNFDRISEDGNKGNSLRKPAYQFLLARNRSNGHLTYIPLDIIDAETVLLKMEKMATPDSQLDYHLFSADTLIAFDGRESPFAIKNSLVNIIQKIYAGRSSLAAQEFDQLHIYFSRYPREKAPFVQFLEEVRRAWPQTTKVLNQITVISPQHTQPASSTASSS